MKKISEQLQKEQRSLVERGVPHDSFFHVTFNDGSEAKEHDTNWSDFSEHVLVDFMGSQKVVSLSKHPVKKLIINHEGLQIDFDVNNGEEVYQAFVNQVMKRSDGIVEDKIIGRIIGKVKDGKVIEEKFVDGRTGEITGIKL